MPRLPPVTRAVLPAMSKRSVTELRAPEVVSSSGFVRSGRGFGRAVAGTGEVVRFHLLFDLCNLGDLRVDLRRSVLWRLVAPLRDDERADLLAQVVDLLLQAHVLEFLLADRGCVLGLVGSFTGRVLHFVEKTHVDLRQKSESPARLPEGEALVTVSKADG